MQYALWNNYNDRLVVRNTELRLIRYINSWNKKHIEKGQRILRQEIFEIRPVTKVIKSEVAWYLKLFNFVRGKYD